MENPDINNELVRIISSYTLEDYYSDKSGAFMTTEIECFLKPLRDNLKTIIRKKLPSIVKKNRIEVEESHGYSWDKRTRNVKKFDASCQDYQDLRKQAESVFMSFNFIEKEVEKEVVNAYGDLTEIYKEKTGEVLDVKFIETDFVDVVRKLGNTFSNELLVIPNNWKEVISQFIDSDIEKIGELKYIDNYYYDKGFRFVFKSDRFNDKEKAALIAIKKALKTHNFLKTKTEVFLDIRNGLSCKIEFKKKGKIIEQYSQGGNKVISSEIESFYDENNRRSIGKLNRYYYFLLRDYIIGIEFVETGILR